MVSNDYLQGRIDVIRELLEGFEGEHPIDLPDFERWLKEMLDKAESEMFDN